MNVYQRITDVALADKLWAEGLLYVSYDGVDWFIDDSYLGKYSGGLTDWRPSQDSTCNVYAIRLED